MRKDAKQKTSFDHIAEAWDSKAGRVNLDNASGITTMEIHRMIGSLKRKRIYEIACGSGRIARYFAHNGARDIIASDISEKLVELARTQYDATGITYMVRDANDFSKIQKNSLDAIIISQGIFYIDDLDALAKGVYRSLKKGGGFIFTLQHPLYRVSQMVLEKSTDLDGMLEKVKPYLKDRLIKVTKKWGKEGTDVSYWQYKRPLSTYINVCGRHKLPIAEISEPATQVKVNGKMQKCSIPSSLIVKAVKL